MSMGDPNHPRCDLYGVDPAIMLRGPRIISFGDASVVLPYRDPYLNSILI